MMIAFLRIGAAALAGLLAAPVAWSMSYVMMADADLFDQAEGVARVEVARIMPAADGDVETRYLLRVHEVLAGPELKRYEVLVLPGTFDAPHLNFVVDGVPRLAEGATVLLFHGRRHDGVLQPSQLMLGLFGLQPTAQGAFYLRTLEGSREFGKRTGTLRFHAPREPAAFERWIRDRARGVAREPDYLHEDVAVGIQQKFTFSVFNFNPPGSARWFQFDSDQVLPWTASAAGQANTNQDEFASLQQALAAWTDDANSRIHLAYAGTGPNTGVCNDPPSGGGSFEGHVCWNDPGGRIAGSYTCGGGGILGIGGSFASNVGQQFAATTWYPRSSAFVVIQDGAGCFMDGAGGANGAQLLTHEVGHAIGFGHSCGDGNSPACNTDPDINQATMRATIHSDGRGAVLGIDDRAGAAVIYPQGDECTGECIFRSSFE